MAKSASTSSLFLYEPPFVVPENQSSEAQYIYASGTMGESEERQLQGIRELILKTAHHENLIQILGEGQVSDVETNTGSMRWAINWMDFRGLLDDYVMAKLIGCLQTEEAYMENCFADLHARLGILYDHRVLNTMAHRTIRAISAIPYPVSLNEANRTWKDVHEEYPFIWICITMQALVHSEFRTKPRVRR